MGGGRRVIDLKYSENEVSIELCGGTISACVSVFTPGRVVVAGERSTMRLTYRNRRYLSITWELLGTSGENVLFVSDNFLGAAATVNVLHELPSRAKQNAKIFPSSQG